MNNSRMIRYLKDIRENGKTRTTALPMGQRLTSVSIETFQMKNISLVRRVRADVQIDRPLLAVKKHRSNNLRSSNYSNNDLDS